MICEILISKEITGVTFRYSGFKVCFFEFNNIGLRKFNFKMTHSELEDRLIEFSVEAIRFSEQIKSNYTGIHLSKQLIRSTTSTALNYGEVRGASSKKDFIHKKKIVLKELRESQNNFKIIFKANLYRDTESIKRLMKENGELVAIFVSSVRSAEKNLGSA